MPVLGWRAVVGQHSAKQWLWLGDLAVHFALGLATETRPESGLLDDGVSFLSWVLLDLQGEETRVLLWEYLPVPSQAVQEFAQLVQVCLLLFVWGGWAIGEYLLQVFQHIVQELGAQEGLLLEVVQELVQVPELLAVLELIVEEPNNVHQSWYEYQLVSIEECLFLDFLVLSRRQHVLFLRLETLLYWHRGDWPWGWHRCGGWRLGLLDHLRLLDLEDLGDGDFRSVSPRLTLGDQTYYLKWGQFFGMYFYLGNLRFFFCRFRFISLL